MPTEAEKSKEHKRATYTIDVLGLNDRLLPAVRRAVYEAYLGLLEWYQKKRTARASRQELDWVVKALQNLGHHTIWEEIKRQRDQISELQELFDEVPEALDW